MVVAGGDPLLADLTELLAELDADTDPEAETDPQAEVAQADR